MTRAAPALLGVAFVLAGASNWDPQILTLRFPDGHQEQIAAVDRDSCDTAILAIRRGWWRVPEGAAQVEAHCGPGDLFAPGWDCIASYNCGAHR